MLGTQAQQPFICYAAVQTDKTKESMREVVKEMRAIIGDRPATTAELAKAQDIRTLTLPGYWETMSNVGGSIQELLRYNLPDDYFTKYPAAVRALTVGDLTGTAKRVVQPDHITWVVVGDRSKIEAEVRELNLGEIQYVDSDGNLVK